MSTSNCDPPLSPPSTARRRAPDFIKKLYFALEAAQKNAEDDLRWVAPGQFEITGDTKGALAVLQRYQLDFNLFSSFVRQLSYYNFKRLSDRRRSESRGRSGAKHHIHFGHPSAEFYSGDADKAFASIVRKGRNREKKQPKSLANSNESPRGSSSDAGSASPSTSIEHERRFSTTSIDSRGASTSEYVVEQPIALPYERPPLLSKPAYIQLASSSAARCSTPVYPSPLSPAMSPYWQHELSTTSSSSYTMPSTEVSDSGENPFSQTFGAALALPSEPYGGLTVAHTVYQPMAYNPVESYRWSYPGAVVPNPSFAYLPTPPNLVSAGLYPDYLAAEGSASSTPKPADFYPYTPTTMSNSTFEAQQSSSYIHDS